MTNAMNRFLDSTMDEVTLLTSFRRMILILKKKHVYKRYVNNYLGDLYSHMRYGNANELSQTASYDMVEKRILGYFGNLAPTDKKDTWYYSSKDVFFIRNFSNENISFYWQVSPEGREFWESVNYMLQKLYHKWELKIKYG